MSLLSMPMPKALVATMAFSSPRMKRSWCRAVREPTAVRGTRSPATPLVLSNSAIALGVLHGRRVDDADTVDLRHQRDQLLLFRLVVVDGDAPRT